jgi:hypothetical protein
MAKTTKNEIHINQDASNNDLFAGYTKHPAYEVYVLNNAPTKNNEEARVTYRPVSETNKTGQISTSIDRTSVNKYGYKLVDHNYLYDVNSCVSDKANNLYSRSHQTVKQFRPLRIHPLFANEPFIRHIGDRFQCQELNDMPYHDFGPAIIQIPGYEGKSLRLSKMDPIFYSISDWTLLVETFDFSLYRPDLPAVCNGSIKRHLQEEYVELASIDGASRKVKLIHPQRFGDADAHLVHGFMKYPIDADYRMMLRVTSYDTYIRSSAEVSISLFES